MQTAKIEEGFLVSILFGEESLGDFGQGCVNGSGLGVVGDFGALYCQYSTKVH
ncbi:MAG: hypothetical protein KF845_10820 [Cyclobacteriaceae bacterium]|nr:hypothetical protein [Cyclobacteriaceae bacterium]